jgi:hypothetical protein
MNRNRLQKGSALSILLILSVGVGSVVTSFLGRTLVEQARVLQRGAGVRAYRQAVGQLELAKAVVNASGFANGSNIAVTAALAADPPVIPGTGVLVEAAGPSRWYRLTSFGEFGNQSSAVYAYMRDGTPYVAYNYYVEDDSLGVSGKPRGKIHTNRGLEFYYAGGVYDDYISAHDGFTYKNGATAANTTFAGGTDPNAAVKDLLDFVDYSALKAKAKVVTPANLEAVVTFLTPSTTSKGVTTYGKSNVRIDLWTKASTIVVATTKYKQVQTGTVQQWVTVTDYAKVWQWVDVSVTSKVWVPVDTSKSSGGTDLGGGGNAGGYWKTVTTVQKQWKQVNVAVGTHQVLQWVPVYTNVPYTAYVNQTVPAVLQSSNTYAADNQIFYFTDNVKGLAGDVNGHVTLVGEHNFLITGNLRYKDSTGQYAYLNGLDDSKPYDPNPKFTRDHALGVMTVGDIRYATTSPDKMEINASLISSNGVVGMDGIVVATVAGNLTKATGGSGSSLSLSGTAVVKTSLRRFGSVMSSKRPVSTLLDDAGQVLHGFRSGASTFDRNNMLNPPPGFPNEDVVMWVPTMKAPGADFTSAGGGSYDSSLVTPLGKLTPMASVHSKVHQKQFKFNKNVTVSTSDDD